MKKEILKKGEKAKVRERREKGNERNNFGRGSDTMSHEQRRRCPDVKEQRGRRV